jgi:Heterokaryon incompatibility protein (HET)
MGLYDELPLPATEQSIRLIAFRSANDQNEPLAAELLVVPLDSNPEYVAISYCWGPPTSTRPVTCNNTIIEIREGLAQGLTRVRSMSSLPLWVDQICINQDDGQERSAQVALMKRIYSQATKTFVYLGEPDSEASRDACRVLETLEVPVVRRLDFGWDGASYRNLFRAGLTAIKLAMQNPCLIKTSHDKDVREAIVRLTCRPYFSRKWIIQELAMSRSVSLVIGSHCFSWKLFLSTVMIAGSKVQETAFNERIQVGWLLWMTDNNAGVRTHPLLTLLYYSRFKAIDPRDYVFALLGAASDSVDVPRPDYEMAVDHLYHEVSCCFVRQGRAFLMFHLVGMRSTENGLPSWVVDWRDLDTWYPSKHFASFHAGGRDGYVSLCAGNTTIRTSGKIVDRVVALGDPFNDELGLLDRLEHYIDHCSDAFEIFYEKGTTKQAIQRDLASLIAFEMRFNPLDPLRKLFVFDENNHDANRCLDLGILDDVSRSELYLMNAQFYAMQSCKWLSERGKRMAMDGLSRLCQKISTNIESPRMLTRYGLMKGLYCSNATESLLRWNFFKPTTRPIMTHNRRLGLAPALTQKEDIVCVVLGAKAPLILRPSEHGTYKIVGEAYVQDIMFGATLNDERYPVQEILSS